MPRFAPKPSSAVTHVQKAELDQRLADCERNLGEVVAWSVVRLRQTKTRFVSLIATAKKRQRRATYQPRATPWVIGGPSSPSPVGAGQVLRDGYQYVYNWTERLPEWLLLDRDWRASGQLTGRRHVEKTAKLDALSL